MRHQSDRQSTLAGTAALPAGAGASVSTAVTVSVALSAGAAPSAALRVSFSASAALHAWQLCVKWASDAPVAPASMPPWRASGYSQAGNSTRVATKLDYFGWPGLWIYTPDASRVAYFALSIADDFSNPLTWRGATIPERRRGRLFCGAAVSVRWRPRGPRRGGSVRRGHATAPLRGRGPSCPTCSLRTRTP